MPSNAPPNAPSASLAKRMLMQPIPKAVQKVAVVSVASAEVGAVDVVNATTVQTVATPQQMATTVT